MMEHRAKRLTAWARHAVLGAGSRLRPWLGRLTMGALTGALVVVVGIILLFEEWGWEPLHRAMAALSRLRPVAALEQAIMRLPPYGALAAFAAPILLLIPVKLGALYLLTAGHPVLAVSLLIAAKLVGTGIVARIYHLTRPQLMRIGWVARAHDVFMPWKEALFARVRTSWAWRWGRIAKVILHRRLGPTVAGVAKKLEQWL